MMETQVKLFFFTGRRERFTKIERDRKYTRERKRERKKRKKERKRDGKEREVNTSDFISVF
jgi:hypothetical protein